ncbi:MAG: hypothetical protein QG670_2355 [Thermoproteota archaeon]|nr:hypothetical protein [Thermoproteota archaeon]
MTEGIDDILEFLASTERNYSIVDLSVTLNIPCDKCRSIMNFLVKYGFVNSIEEEFQINPKIKDILVDSSEEHPSEIRPNLTI